MARYRRMLGRIDESISPRVSPPRESDRFIYTLLRTTNPVTNARDKSVGLSRGILPQRSLTCMKLPNGGADCSLQIGKNATLAGRKRDRYKTTRSYS